MERRIEYLDVNGFLHRFADMEMADDENKTVGDAEGAFLICTFWLAQLLVRRGDIKRAKAILWRAEETAGDLRLFSEAIDARCRSFLGNMPPVFNQIEYARAVMDLSEAKDRADSQVAVSRGEKAEAGK